MKLTFWAWPHALCAMNSACGKAVHVDFYNKIVNMAIPRPTPLDDRHLRSDLTVYQIEVPEIKDFYHIEDSSELVKKFEEHFDVIENLNSIQMPMTFDELFI